MRRPVVMIRLIIFLSIILPLSACSGVDIKDYSGQQPKFDLFDYFAGETRGWGMVQNRSGEVTRQFVVDIQGELTSRSQLVLTEDFSWDDGEQSQRIWTIGQDSQHQFSGTAADVVGQAAGQAYGNALNWTYQLDVPLSDKTVRLTFDDWMFLQPDQILINRAKMTKFGIRVGEVTIVFSKNNSR